MVCGHMCRRIMCTFVSKYSAVIETLKESYNENQNHQETKHQRTWSCRHVLWFVLRSDWRELSKASLLPLPAFIPGAEAAFSFVMFCFSSRGVVMQIGLNFTLGNTLDLVQRLIREGEVDYCELLIDNFLHVPPHELAGAFDCPIGFHIMFSKFLESDPEYLESMAARLRTYIDVLKPMYVSDHVARFNHNGRQLYHLAELDYRSEYDAVRQRVERWQEKLGQRLYLENYPSIMDSGCDAPGFFERITQETGGGMFFDASNAVCAHHNCGLAPVKLSTQP